MLKPRNETQLVLRPKGKLTLFYTEVQLTIPEGFRGATNAFMLGDVYCSPTLPNSNADVWQNVKRACAWWWIGGIYVWSTSHMQPPVADWSSAVTPTLPWSICLYLLSFLLALSPHTLWGIKTHQNTFVHNFSKCWPILIEIGVQRLG